ncbi:DUF6624 domain-containing protein [Ideonella azotifigens]
MSRRPDAVGGKLAGPSIKASQRVAAMGHGIQGQGPCSGPRNRLAMSCPLNSFASKSTTQVNNILRNQLLAMASRDERVRAELQAEGTLLEGYHPRMEAVHRANAADLRALMEEHGWPSEALVGPEGAEAAWLVLQHSIAEPGFMRHCRTLIDEASRIGLVPRWQFAYLDDRIRVFEGKAQRFGTQFDLTPDGPELNALEDPSQVDRWRREAGLGPVSEVLSRARGLPLPSHEEYASKQVAGNLWRRDVGWVT